MTIKREQRRSGIQASPVIACRIASSALRPCLIALTMWERTANQFSAPVFEAWQPEIFS
ncbi:MAG: hypothetical protein HOV87_26300 [Catenulispora sp.]|nr:hypothetical protein [Catenulispora sp.]